jgi:hypothetical protein
LCVFIVGKPKCSSFYAMLPGLGINQHYGYAPN